MHSSFITISTKSTVRDLKQAISEKSDVETKYRLVYLGTSLATLFSSHLLMPSVKFLHVIRSKSFKGLFLISSVIQA